MYVHQKETADDLVEAGSRSVTMTNYRFSNEVVRGVNALRLAATGESQFLCLRRLLTPNC
jgi:hypothetical protein